MLKLKEEGLTKFIGFSSMAKAEITKEALNRFEFDACIITLNPIKKAHMAYADEVVPLAKKKNVGLAAFKVMRNLVSEQVTPGSLLSYALSTDGIASALISHFGIEPLRKTCAS